MGRPVRTNDHEPVDLYSFDSPPPKSYGHYAQSGFHNASHKLAVMFANAERFETKRADACIHARTRQILGGDA